MHVNLRAKNIIVVGGASGIGYATAQKLLDEGAQKIVLASRNITKLETATKTLKCGWRQKVFAMQFD